MAGCCVVVSREGRHGKQSLWVVSSADRRGALSFQHNLRRRSPFWSVALFVAAAVYGASLIHTEGAFEESASVRLFLWSSSNTPLPLFTLECQSLALFLYLRLSVFIFF